ncbi:MAG TPA: enoyl-CoA hydratase-related protein [Acidimicrobiia bacterium]
MLLSEDRDRVRLLTFNRPDRANAFNEELYHASADALRAAAADDDVAVVVFTGAGKAFCAGTDLLEMAETVDGTAPSRDGFPAFVDVLQEFPKPLMAAVNGAAVGLGFTMLAHCDLVFVSDKARLLAPFTNMGVAPEAASSYLLPRRMGRQQASLSLFTSDWISAEDAVATGLAVRQCSPETLVDETIELATRIASKSLPSLMATKRLLLDAEREGIARARTLENAAFAELLALPNAKDGVLGQLD